MTMQRIVGLVVLAAGIAILVIGLNASDSAGEQIREGFTGHYSDKTTWFIIGGIPNASEVRDINRWVGEGGREQC